MIGIFLVLIDELSYDFESLNSAIQDLANIIRPLGRWFGN